MEPFLVSTAVVGLAEIGDRTQLLALALACKYKRPVVVTLGIFIGALACNLAAALAGEALSALIPLATLRWILVASFIAMAIWLARPEKKDPCEDEQCFRIPKKRTALAATVICFILSEAGDKTQFATATMAAHFNAFGLVVAGSTFGMMLANVPAVIFGHCMSDKLTKSPVTRYIAAAIFAAQAVLMLVTQDML